MISSFEDLTPESCNIYHKRYCIIFQVQPVTLHSTQTVSVFQMEQLSDEEIDHGAEEDSDKEDQDLDKMFGAWLGELDKLTQVRNST